MIRCWPRGLRPMRIVRSPDGGGRRTIVTLLAPRKSAMRTERDGFSGMQRVLHWLMASHGARHAVHRRVDGIDAQPRFLTLISIHKPLGIAILALALLRLGVRLRSSAPPFPDDLPGLRRWQPALALRALCTLDSDATGRLGDAVRRRLSRRALWFSPSACDSTHDDQLHTILRTTHTVLAYMFFATTLLHVATALFHALIRRDGYFEPWRGSGPGTSNRRPDTSLTPARGSDSENVEAVLDPIERLCMSPELARSSRSFTKSGVGQSAQTSALRRQARFENLIIAFIACMRGLTSQVNGGSQNSIPVARLPHLRRCTKISVGHQRRHSSDIPSSSIRPLGQREIVRPKCALSCVLRDPEERREQIDLVSEGLKPEFQQGRGNHQWLDGLDERARHQLVSIPGATRQIHACATPLCCRACPCLLLEQRPIAFGEFAIKVGVVGNDYPDAHSKCSNGFRVNPMSADHFIRNAGEVSDFRGYWILRFVERRKDVRNLRYSVVRR